VDGAARTCEDPMTEPKSKPKSATRLTARKIAKPCLASETSSKTRYQARPHHCDATDVYGRNECSDHDCYRLAAVFGPRLSCRWRAAGRKGEDGHDSTARRSTGIAGRPKMPFDPQGAHQSSRGSSTSEGTFDTNSLGNESLALVFPSSWTQWFRI
jgi:hypothetical protein